MAASSAAPFPELAQRLATFHSRVLDLPDVNPVRAVILKIMVLLRFHQYDMPASTTLQDVMDGRFERKLLWEDIAQTSATRQQFRACHGGERVSLASVGATAASRLELFRCQFQGHASQVL
jgi:hypothetical protein